MTGSEATEPIIEEARRARENAYAPYSRLRVGAALRAASGAIYRGCNVENASYPEGLCAEAAAIAAMVSAGDTVIVAAAIAADTPEPVTPCGGCRQKLAEFAAPEVAVTMTTMGGARRVMSVGALLPGAFGPQHLSRGAK